MFHVFRPFGLLLQHEYSPDSDGESKYKRHKRDHRDGSRKGGHDDLEDGELGEDGEIS